MKSQISPAIHESYLQHHTNERRFHHRLKPRSKQETPAIQNPLDRNVASTIRISKNRERPQEFTAPHSDRSEALQTKYKNCRSPTIERRTKTEELNCRMLKQATTEVPCKYQTPYREGELRVVVTRLELVI